MNLFWASCLICILSSLFLSIFFLVLRKKTNAILYFSGFIFSTLIWGIGTFMFSNLPRTSYEMSMFWWQFAYTGVFFAAVFFFHFTVKYLELKRKALVACVYVLGFVYTFFNWYDNSRYFLGDLHYVFNQFYWVDALKYKNPLWFLFYFGFYWILLCYDFFLLWMAFRRSDGDKRNRFKYLIIGAGIGWLGTNPLFLPAFHINVYPVSNFLIAAYPLITAYAIVRHQVMDIKVVIKKTLVFAGLLASVFAMLILPTLLIQEYILRAASFGGRMIGLAISGVIIILTMRRIEHFLIDVTDKFLFQKKYDYKGILRTFTAEVLTLLELNKLVNVTVEKLADIIKLKSAALLLFDKESQEFNVMASQNITDASVKLIRPDGMVTFMEETHGYILMNELREKNMTVPPPIQDIVDKLNAELLIPLILHEEVMGILSLGKKKSDENYTQDDLDILLPLAKTLAIAISNAELFDELGKTQAEAAQKEKMAVIGTLSAGINHEICNPLGIARGQCEAFLLNIKDGLYKSKTNEELIEKAKDIMSKVIKETDRATAITKKLSGFAKPSKGEAEMVHIAKEVEEVLGLVGYELKLDKIEFKKYIQSDISDLFVDRKQFQEILFNLIRNAGQAIQDRGRITISVTEDDGKVFIDIKDTGSGIPEDKIKQLFNPFFTTKDPGKGTGLGLFIVRQIVEKNGGRIYLKETKFGEGTTFRLEFPTVQKKEQTAK